ncbi:hypothetical protein J8273_4830 [Carpediemonas membranifera]|uniref:Uncharacterized protein n=1 Tax=Carpediemonas membranifera TaxID=201153 RepID=A0A8J6BXQ0_9EUKA|nr:hypothetical protein J8273_4830 [Carpediemonas membranifera]|eukprot:KAG9393711.1 hypothetical protein J8273_4830 [Carpediemonas membranifera]
MSDDEGLREEIPPHRDDNVDDGGDFIQRNHDMIDTLLIQIDSNLRSGNLDVDAEDVQFSINEEQEEDEFEAELNKEARSLHLPRRRTRSQVRSLGEMRLPAAVTDLLGRANIAFINQNRVETVRLCMDAIRLAPQTPEPYRLIGLSLEDTGSERVALDFFFVAAHLSRRAKEPWKICADIAQRTGHEQYYLYCLRKMTPFIEDEDDLGAHLIETHSAYRVVGDMRGAGRCLEALYHVRPDPAVLQLCVEYYLETKLYGRLVRFLEKLLDSAAEPDLGILNILAEVHGIAGNYTTVITTIQKHTVGGLNGLHPELLVRLAIAFVHTRQWTHALAAIERFAPPIDDFADLYFELGRTCVSASDQAVYAQGLRLLAVTEAVPSMAMAVNLILADSLLQRLAKLDHAGRRELLTRYSRVLAVDPTAPTVLKAANACGRLGLKDTCLWLLGFIEPNAAVTSGPLGKLVGPYQCPFPADRPTDALRHFLGWVHGSVGDGAQAIVDVCRGVRAETVASRSDTSFRSSAFSRTTALLLNEFIPTVLTQDRFYTVAIRVTLELVRENRPADASKLINAAVASRMLDIWGGQRRVDLYDNLRLLTVLIGAQCTSSHSQLDVALLEQHPDSQRLWESFLLQETRSVARKAYKAAIFKKNTYGTLFRASTAFWHGSYEQAVPRFEEVAAKCPGDPLPHFMLGLSLLFTSQRRRANRNTNKNDQVVQAVERMARYSELRGDPAEAAYNTARMLQYCRMVHLCSPMYMSILQGRPSEYDSGPTQPVSSWQLERAQRPAAVNMARLLADSGNRREAARVLKEYMTI